MARYLSITGGVGGAKLAVGLAQILSPDEVLFAVNTGDDFEHLGLHISPDIDSLSYALAQENNKELGWGRAGETWQFITTLGELGGADWFRLGDKDLALHMRRRQLLDRGDTLTQATHVIATALGIPHQIVPMSDDPVRTIVHSDQGDLAFQHYFVKERCEPKVSGFSFAGVTTARLNPLITDWLQDCDGIIICPSNPFVSVAPLLAVPGFLAAIQSTPVIAVSPIVGGLALKGPAAKMMAELKMPATAVAVAEYYDDLLSGFILDQTDAESLALLKLPAIATDTVMVTLQKSEALAQDCLAFLAALPRKTLI